MMKMDSKGVEIAYCANLASSGTRALASLPLNERGAKTCIGVFWLNLAAFQSASVAQRNKHVN